MSAAAFPPGFFGKLPARGDFITRGLPPSFLTPWEAWLHEIWRIEWQRFGDVWPSLVDSGPIWRFAFEGGACGPDAVAGLIAPSCDRTGRVFPLCVAAAVPPQADPAALPVIGSGWFGRAESLLRDALVPTAEPDHFEAQLRTLGPPGRSAAVAQLPEGAPGWHVALDPLQAPALSYPALIHELSTTLPARFTLWWTLGTRRVAPSLVVSSGLPGADALPAFFDGAWDYWGWADADAVYPEED